MVMFVSILLSAILIYFAYTDIRYKILPNKVMVPALVVVSVFRFYVHDDAIWTYFFAGGFAGGIFLILALINSNWVGGGDVKLLILVGILLGWELMMLAFIVISITGFIFSLLTGIIGRSFMRVIPFGPFIAFGALIALWFGDSLLDMLYVFFTNRFTIV